MTIGTLLGGVIALAIGPMVDKYGPRWILAIGGFAMGATFILMAFQQTLWQYYLLQALSRMVAMGVMGLTASVIIPKWFIAKRGRAIALTSLGMRAGNTVTPLLAQALVVMGGWRLSIGVIGVMTTLLASVPAALFLRRKPEDIGLLPDGAASEAEAKAQAAAASKGKKKGPEVSLTIKEVRRERSFYLLVTAFALSFLYMAALNLAMIPYFTDQGISSQTAVTVVAVWSASAGIGGLIMGFLADKVSLRLLLPVGFTFIAISFVFLLFARSPQIALVWGFYHGVLGGGVFLLQQVVFANYYGRNSLGAIGGMVWPVQMVTNAIGPLAGSWAFDALGSYTLIFSIFSGLALVSATCAFLAKPPVPRTPAVPSAPAPASSAGVSR
jgi:MFS family permease